jgi:tRNA1(Val) A37 N6-methylase TrmN6
MNVIRVKLPFTEIEIEQSAEGHGITDAAAFLQETVISNCGSEELNGLELGCGNGIISLMLGLQRPQWKLTGIELQEDLAELARQNAERLSVKLEVVTGDIRECRAVLNYQAYDLVYSNPPWVKAGSGIVSPVHGRALSRQEIACTMTDVLLCLEWTLAQTGTAFVIYPLERETELDRELRRSGLEAVNMYKSDTSPRSFISKLKRRQRQPSW